jgi:hypothetical protein
MPIKTSSILEEAFSLPQKGKSWEYWIYHYMHMQLLNILAKCGQTRIQWLGNWMTWQEGQQEGRWKGRKMSKQEDEQADI